MNKLINEIAWNLFLVVCIPILFSGSVFADADPVPVSPPCMDENYPGLIKHSGEFIVEADKQSSSVAIGDILKQASTEFTWLSAILVPAVAGKRYIQVNFETSYRSDQPFDAIWIARRKEGQAKAYAALDRLATLPGIKIMCDEFSPTKPGDAFNSIRWNIPGIPTPNCR